MNIDTVKVELIDWIARLNDQDAIDKILVLKRKMSLKEEKSDTRIFGSGKHLVEYIADDFNEPLDAFKEHQK